MPDPFSAITSAPAEFIAQFAEVMEQRAANPRQIEMRDSYLDTIDFGSGRVLEVGCGGGPVTRALAARDDTTEVVGIDPSPQFIDHARKLDAGASYEVGDALALRFGDDTFDVVVFHTVLSHLPEPDAAIAEAVRVTRPGGTVSVFDGDYCSTTLSSGPDDVLQRCADTYIASVVHDPWFMRTCIQRLTAAGLDCGPQVLHGFTDPDYLLATAGRGVDALVAAGSISDDEAEHLRTEAAARHANGTLYGHMLYASIVATKPAHRP